MLVLGIEGTAWNLSAAVVSDEGEVAEVSHTYVPKEGGIHPREAAQHHSEHMPRILEQLCECMAQKGLSLRDVDGVAFSQGPGLGPALRTVATAARTLSMMLEVPLVGVNHCLAHIEIGKWDTGAHDPMVVYASGANTQILALSKGRYRVFGETIDIGLGNALDKFARAIGMSHPGGPKIEQLARKANSYVPLPYTVKGMDLAFSGLITAAKNATREHPIEDVCFSLQEHAFAMLVEVSERAIAHTGKEEVLLVGGVGANERLSEMMRIMCTERGIAYHRPKKRYLGDNGTMIAILGMRMLKHGITTPIERSEVIAGYRPDMVEVVW
ncbi:bifunctional N(6)-L-threonylcarbamoyladenine synthase/serine/threonine protein kinase [Methermicoccus shengliensis]|uniref:tRNA N6-adenosine threonylcarbamoyltransferase n=1 Tax=Methermicoccus shengliensis TaxID=660064 RepID=A0A832VZZ0_9EURY|nr:bifunctional N(6)-L-threonylcarbamoyladenine synthase/serine/threonine protein kinase [Methermicoccus shengliensis]KUK04928.1 MAG: putative tRNA threonylcarbamoyladenosine biosynthesis protein KAE1-like protein [Euryarchaeota archaeon 55_53]KUK30913.1 MAG: putative tRNA threonylcarbamoyladenosine biosynthesis protein KAE1-like protein [Methanosarcinales archeaon 56_1174]MDI3487626.1 N6-L-threonylcarbamoyladenine synthase [Methanosarcinales archaeon]MDN5294959.1 N6-L-threonylcarbamoyladenine 